MTLMPCFFSKLKIQSECPKIQFPIEFLVPHLIFLSTTLLEIDAKSLVSLPLNEEWHYGDTPANAT